MITFHTTAEAIACEKMSKGKQLTGRMIPVPREVSAGCGLAWCAKPEDRSILEYFLSQEQISIENIMELWY